MKDQHVADIRRKKWARAVNEAETGGGDGTAAKSLLLSSGAAIGLLLKRMAEGTECVHVSESDCVALKFLAEGISRYAAGEPIGSALLLGKRIGRPEKSPIENLLDYVLPVSLLVDEGKAKEDAIKAVARKAGVAIKTVTRGIKLYEKSVGPIRKSEPVGT